MTSHHQPPTPPSPSRWSVWTGYRNRVVMFTYHIVAYELWAAAVTVTDMWAFILSTVLE